MLMSEVKVVHDIRLDMERIIPRLNLVNVGELVRREPESASGSLNPWVINLAFARGDPSGLVDHLRMKWAFRTRLESACCGSQNSHTSCSKKGLGEKNQHSFQKTTPSFCQRDSWGRPKIMGPLGCHTIP